MNEIKEPITIPDDYFPSAEFILRTMKKMEFLGVKFHIIELDHHVITIQIGVHREINIIIEPLASPENKNHCNIDVTLRHGQSATEVEFINGKRSLSHMEHCKGKEVTLIRTKGIKIPNYEKELEKLETGHSYYLRIDGTMLYSADYLDLSELDFKCFYHAIRLNEIRSKFDFGMYERSVEFYWNSDMLKDRKILLNQETYNRVLEHEQNFGNNFAWQSKLICVK